MASPDQGSNAELIAAFVHTMRDAGLDPAESIISDGKLHRLQWRGDRVGKRNGYYVLHLDGSRPAGAFGCWKRGLKRTWTADGAPLEPEVRRELAAKIDADRERREREERARQERVARQAADAWEACSPAPPDHPYLARKGIGSHGARVDRDGRLVVPLRDIAGKICSLQIIDVAGGKRYLRHGRKRGCFCLLGEPADRIAIAEGFATAASIREATSLPVAVAYDAGNLEPVAVALRDAYPNASILIIADDDFATEGNPGLREAAAAAETVGGLWVAPRFTDPRDRGTDFNDLAQREGPATVRAQIEAGFGPSLSTGGSAEIKHPTGENVADLATYRARTARLRVEAMAANALEREQRRRTREAATAEHEEIVHDPAAQYEATPGGLVLRTATERGVSRTPLCNFVAKITAEVVREDGAEQTRRFEIEAKVGERRLTASIGADEFDGMDWVTRELGSATVVYAGRGRRDHVRAAIQLLSSEVIQRTVYTHTGWHVVDGHTVYLHAGGAITAGGMSVNIETDLEGCGLGLLALPDPPQGERCVEVVRASLGMLDVAPLDITAPIFAGAVRAPLGQADFGVFEVGPTGVFKTQLAALAQQHFGAGMDGAHLPGSWTSTANSLEALAFAAKDALLVVDDFAPAGGAENVRLHREAGRLLRAQGNNAGRQRMRPDGTLRPAKPPRGLLLSTGEDVPTGQSIRARNLIVEVAKGQIDPAKLTRCQEDAAAGLYAGAMAGYLSWLAIDLNGRLAWFQARRNELRRERVEAEAHARIPWIVADLAAALELFLMFGVEIGALTVAEHDELARHAQAALRRVAGRQTEHQQAENPASRFVELVAALLSSKEVHLARYDAPERNPWDEYADAMGWQGRVVTSQDGLGPAREHIVWTPSGRRIGWLNGEVVYLEADAAYAAAQKLALVQGQTLAVQPRTLWKRLGEVGLLVARDKDRQTYTCYPGGRRVRNTVGIAKGLICAGERDKRD